jgi:hypothetical protein
MSMLMEEGTKRWAVTRKSALVLEVLQRKNKFAEASRPFSLLPPYTQQWILRLMLWHVPRIARLRLVRGYAFRNVFAEFDVKNKRGYLVPTRMGWRIEVAKNS